MVEGGARVIQSFLAANSAGEDPASRVIDTVVVTVAPVMVGDDGIGYGANVSSSVVSTLRRAGHFRLLLADLLLCLQVGGLEHVRTELFGRDVVFALKFIK